MLTKLIWVFQECNQSMNTKKLSFNSKLHKLFKDITKEKLATI